MWMKRGFNDCQTHRSMYPSIFNRFKSNQIKSTVDLVSLLQVERRRITLSRLVRSLELVTVGCLEQERFQAALESWRGTHQREFCWQPIPCLRSSDGERPLTEFQTGPGGDIIVMIIIDHHHATRRPNILRQL